MQSKPWYLSKTIWINLTVLGIAVASVIADPALAADPRIATAAAGVVTVGNIALRLITAVPIAGTPAATDAAAPPHG